MPAPYMKHWLLIGGMQKLKCKLVHVYLCETGTVVHSSLALADKHTQKLVVMKPIKVRTGSCMLGSACASSRIFTSSV